MRGPEEWPSRRKTDRIRLTGPAATIKAVRSIGFDGAAFGHSHEMAPFDLTHLDLTHLDLTHPACDFRVQNIERQRAVSEHLVVKGANIEFAAE
jgi:hypothetical protein